MGNYEQLKQAVAAVIKQNGNYEITGNILQNTLLTIISNIGANKTFAGVAIPTTNPGNPDANIFYIAQNPGLYQYFNNIQIANPGINLLYHNGTNWVSVQISPNIYATRLPSILITRTDVMNNDVWINIDSYNRTFTVTNNVKYFRIDGTIGIITPSYCGLNPVNYDKEPIASDMVVQSSLICWDENNNELIPLDYSLGLRAGYIPLGIILLDERNWVVFQSNCLYTIDGVAPDTTVNTNLHPVGLSFRKTAGYVPLNTGLQANANFEVSDYIPVTSGQRIYFTLRTGSNIANNGTGIVGYNDNKEFVKYLWQNPNIVPDDGNAVTYYNRSIVIPDGVTFIRGCSKISDGIPLQIGTSLDLKETTDTLEIYGGKDWRKKIVQGNSVRGTSTPGYVPQSYYYKGIIGIQSTLPDNTRAIFINTIYVDRLLELSYDVTKWNLGLLFYDVNGNEIYFDRNNFYAVRTRIELAEPFMFAIQFAKKDNSVITDVDLTELMLQIRYKKANRELFTCVPENIRQNYSYSINPTFFVLGSRTGAPGVNVISNMFYTSRIFTTSRCLLSYRVKALANNVRIDIADGYDMFVVVDNEVQTELDTSWVNSTTYLATNVANKYIGIGIRKIDDSEITTADIEAINLSFTGMPDTEKELPYNYNGEKLTLGNKFNRTIYLDMAKIDSNPPRGAQQGFAIHGRYGFVMYDGGYCSVVDMDKKTLVSQFPLAVVATNNHVNNSNFGVEFPAGNTQFPAIYNSKFRDTGECFVENITLENSTLLQTISLQLANNPIYGISWAVDVQNKNLWAIGYKLENWATIEGNAIYYAKFRLPLISEGDIMFTDDDVIERFEMPYRVHQGFYITDNKIFAPWGIGNNCGLVVLDILTKQYITDVPLGQWGAEPEGIDEYNDSIIISHNHGGKGQLIEISF